MPNHLGFKKSLARRWRSRGALSGEIKNSTCQAWLLLLPDCDVIQGRQTFKTQRLLVLQENPEMRRAAGGWSPSKTGFVVWICDSGVGHMGQRQSTCLVPAFLFPSSKENRGGSECPRSWNSGDGAGVSEVQAHPRL